MEEGLCGRTTVFEDELRMGRRSADALPYARQNPLHFIITTAGNNRHSIAFELHTKAVDILEGRRVDPTFYPVVYGLKDDEDWEDEAEKFILLPFFWIPEEAIPRRVKHNSVPYDVWEKQGYILSIEGNVVHYAFIEQFIQQLEGKYHNCKKDKMKRIFL